MRLLSVVVLLAWTTAGSSVCTDVCPTDGVGWRSNLTATVTMPTYVVVEWNQDVVGNSTSYKVRWSGSSVFSREEETPSLMFNITGLVAAQNYMVEVCRVTTLDTDDDCGNCSLCVTTLQAPPSPPETVQVQVVGPETMTVSWSVNSQRADLDDITEFHVLCVESVSGAVVLNTSQNSIDVRPDLADDVTLFDLDPATTYDCSVAASNVIGIGPYSDPVQGATAARVDEPGVLLMAYPSSVDFAVVTETSVIELATYIDNRVSLFSTSSSVTGLDYHFHRGEIYYTTDNRTLSRVGVNLTNDNSLSVRTGPEQLLQVTDPVVSSLGSVAVDWVFNEVYWIENSGSGTRIMRGVLGGGDLLGPYCVVDLSPGEVRHIIADPVRGYLFWNDGTGLHRAPLSTSSVRANSTACPSAIAGKETLVDGDIITFTLESDQIYLYRAHECIPTYPYSFSVANLNGDNIKDYIGTRLRNVSGLASFTQRSLYTLNGIETLVISTPLTNPLICGGNLGSIIAHSDIAATLIRMYRSSQQPLPAPTFPVETVRVTPSDNTAAISWSAPRFTGSLFSSSAFSNWEYTVEYRALSGGGVWSTRTTPSLSVNITDLTPGTLYEFNIVTRGPAGSTGETRLGFPLVFTTRTEATLELLVATQDGVLRTDTTGLGTECVDNSQGASGVTHDSYTGTSYWTISNGRDGSLWIKQGVNRASLYDNLNSPFFVRLDWVTRRLFWVESAPMGGSHQIMEVSVDSGNPTTPQPKVFQQPSSTVTIATTALDARNGFLFWVSGETISRRSLGGVEYGECHKASSAPTALTVDPDRQRLYWLSNRDGGGALTVNQLEYNATECAQTVQARDLPDISFSASATVLAYASNTLFIASQVSNVTFSIPSDSPSVPSDRRIAVSSFSLSSECGAGDTVIIRDIAFTSSSGQPLPNGLMSSQRRLLTVTPDPVPAPPTLGSASNSSTIVIEWEAPPLVLPDSPLLYLVDYTLNQNPSQQSPVIGMTSLTLTGQQASTTVATSVTVCSLWSCRTAPTSTSTFMSPPAIPGAVTNVRVFVYRPLAGEDVFSALVLWDAPAAVSSVEPVVDTYSVIVRRDGVTVSDIYQPPGKDTYHTLLMRDERFTVTYFSPSSAQFDIQVAAVNPSGTGPYSAPEEFNFTSSTFMYPRQVLALSPGGAQVVGMETDFVTLPSPIDISRPVAVDTITREIYYFSGDLLLNSSIQAGGLDTLLFKVDILAMTFDWVARALYYAVRNDAEGSLELYRVPVLAKNRNTRLFPALAHPLSSSASLQLAVDPTRGFLYWLESNGSLVQLHSLDLRLDNSPASTVLSTTSSRRKRQSNSLASLNLSPVLSLDSVTGALLMASTSGDVHSCNVSTGQCEVVVDASALSATPASIGLPPTSIAVDERHIYWTNPAVAGVYAVERTNRSTLITVSSVNASTLLGLSPGSQPLGSIECLSPDFRMAGERPLPRVTSFNSTTISLEWDEPMLPGFCDSVTFSFPPLTYVPHVSLNPPSAGEPVAWTHETQFTVENLKPFFEYQIQMATFNVFTPRRNRFDTLLSTDIEVVTTEGVPDPPLGLNFVVLGTATVQLIWMQGEPRAAPDNITYYIFTGAGHVTETTGIRTNITINSTNGIVPGSTQTIQVLTSNQVFNSTAASVTVPFWPLAPPPEMIMSTNSSFSATIVLTAPLHEDIRGVALQHCLATTTAVANMACSCPGSDNRTELQAGVAPSSFEFSVGNLTTYTFYCLQSVAVYRMVGQNPAEVTAGLGVVMRTSEGRPDAPLSVTLSGTLLTWSPPPPRSDGGIIRYSIAAYETNNGLRNDTAEVAGSTLMVDLQTHNELDLAVGVFYDVNVRAVNSEGIGPPSDSVEFRREARAVLGLEAIIPIAVSGTVLIALCLCFVLFCVWFIRLGRPKEQEIRSLSYMYGPDHELSNLRDAYRHTQAANPHYTWSLEDYVCTDEDLDLLSKFPRHNLKLENLIGRGEFGEVYQGTAVDILGSDTGPTPVAVKTLRKGAGIEDQRKFLSEASLMSNFNHPNIVKVLGVCLDNDPVYIIMELMPAGDLLKFLREAKRDHGPTLLTLAEQIQVALDVAHGCRYLEQQHFIHRDIAARNCLVSSKGADRVVKIGDFGLARDLYSSDYYQVEGQRKLPVRWMAPEALLQGKFTVESDIWSFGVLLWEIMSLGNQPYPGRINQEVLQFVTGGGRLDKPEKCPSKMYHLMQSCWKRYASDRLHFEQIVTTLSNFLDRIKRPDSVYHSDSDTDTEDDTNPPHRQSSVKTPTRSPSFKSGFMNLARSGSVKLRNSFRRHGSIHKREENAVSQLPEDPNAFRERGPF